MNKFFRYRLRLFFLPIDQHRNRPPVSTNNTIQISAGGHSAKSVYLIKGEETQSEPTTTISFTVADLINGGEIPFNRTT